MKTFHYDWLSPSFGIYIEKRNEQYHYRIVWKYAIVGRASVGNASWIYDRRKDYLIRKKELQKDIQLFMTHNKKAFFDVIFINMGEKV